MAEVGQVTELKGDLVSVKLQRHEACSHCNACSAGVEANDMILEAQNLCKAQPGDLVEISLEESNFLQAVLIMYIAPLFGLLIGVAIGYMIGGLIGLNREIVALVFGFGLLAITYLVIKSNEQRFQTSKFRPIANKIVYKDK